MTVSIVAVTLAGKEAGDHGTGSQAELTELLAAGRRGDAVARFLAGVGLPPESVDEMRRSPDWPGLEVMAHTMLYDGEITEDRGLWAERAASVTAPTLVLFSEGTSGYLGDSARVAAEAIPGALLRILPGQFHEVAPVTLAAELTRFLDEFVSAGRSELTTGNLPSAVDPTRSAKSTVATFRFRASRSRSTGAAQVGQNRAPSGSGAEH